MVAEVLTGQINSNVDDIVNTCIYRGYQGLTESSQFNLPVDGGYILLVLRSSINYIAQFYIGQKGTFVRNTFNGSFRDIPWKRCDNI